MDEQTVRTEALTRMVSVADDVVIGDREVEAFVAGAQWAQQEMHALIVAVLADERDAWPTAEHSWRSGMERAIATVKKVPHV